MEKQRVIYHRIVQKPKSKKHWDYRVIVTKEINGFCVFVCDIEKDTWDRFHSWASHSHEALETAVDIYRAKLVEFKINGKE